MAYIYIYIHTYSIGDSGTRRYIIIIIEHPHEKTPPSLSDSKGDLELEINPSILHSIIITY